jgi:hypothetical protein
MHAVASILLYTVLKQKIKIKTKHKINKNQNEEKLMSLHSAASVLLSRMWCLCPILLLGYLPSSANC